MALEAQDILQPLSGALPQVRAIGPMAFDPIWAQETHVSHAHEIMHVVSGRLQLHLDDHHIDARPGDTVMVPTGTLHRDEFDLQEGLEVFFCEFDWACGAEYFARVPPTALPCLPATCKAELARLFEKLRMDLAGEAGADQLVVRSRLLTVLLLILRAATAPADRAADDYGKARSRSLMGRAKQYMQAHYAERLSLDDIAAALHVSGYHLSHVFSRHSNFSLFSYLTALRMEKAQTLLLGGDLNVSQVAQAVGYQDANYFSKAFRKHCGCSPTEFVAAQGGNA